MDDLYPFVPCPKRCDVATPPERVGPDRWVCAGCGTEFTWRPEPAEGEARPLTQSKRGRR